ncbi:modulator of macroautophagy TMEM150B isoform X3 [Sminthopsis crassicaudata]|uniref:modulator of macroautophagy TMEM150B isoform X3 n=1 Tax=Sminthopsis crassicaudata TaxID=9301 RepID=UPI003D686EB1
MGHWSRSPRGSSWRPPGDVGLPGPAPPLPGAVGYGWSLDNVRGRKAALGQPGCGRRVTPPLSFPSLCGSFPPQSCIFSQFLNVGAAMVAWICVLRYVQFREWGIPKFPNRLCLGLGFLCALGASIVGNFQQTNEFSTHLFGSFLAFVVGVTYFWTQVVLLRLAKPRAQPGAPWIETLRLLLCGLCTALVVAMIVLHFWPRHSEAAVCEWSTAMLLFLLFGLLAVDFSDTTGFTISLQSRPRSCPSGAAHLPSL